MRNVMMVLCVLAIMSVNLPVLAGTGWYHGLFGKGPVVEAKCCNCKDCKCKDCKCDCKGCDKECKKDCKCKDCCCKPEKAVVRKKATAPKADCDKKTGS